MDIENENYISLTPPEISYLVVVDKNGTVHGNLLALEYLQKYKSTTEGGVINVASIAGCIAQESYPVYTGTKHAIIGLSQSLGIKAYYNKYKIKTIVVCPGATITSIGENMEKKLKREQWKMHLAAISDNYSTLQLPSQVAKELTVVLKDGLSGSVWIIENNEPAYEIQRPHYSQMRKY